MDSISKIQIGSNQYQISSQVNTDFANALIGGENLLRCTRYPESTTDSNKIENSWLYGKFVNIQKDGTITTSGVPYINIENCPANSEMEACGAFALDNEVGFCQTSTDSLYIFIAQLVDKYRNTQKGGNTDGVKAISVIPITFSFYCKSTNNTAYILAYPFYDETNKKEFSIPATDCWKKISITADFTIDGNPDDLKQYFQKMGYVCNVSSSTCYIACPMLTIGEYDVDWKPNPLDSKSDIVGVGNLLSNSLNVPYGDNWTNAGYLCLSADDFCSYDISRYVSTTAAHAPVLDSGYPIVKSFIVKVSQNEPAGITQIYNNQGLIEYGKFPGHTALMDFISNSDREIPISMSIWCYAENAVKIALMPIRVSSCNIFAPVTYDDLPAGEWRRFTRTIYIPANEAKTFNNANIWMGGALATGTDSTEVKFALPMVTLGSTPSTWFPSAYDIFSGIDSASSAASSAQTTANTANTNANTALTTANNKVSKSGDTMSGNLNMGGYVLNNVNELYTNYMFSNDEGYIQVSDPTYINEGFCDGSGKAYSSSQLMQGDGSPRTIITNLSNTTSIPTGSAVYNAIRYGNLNIYSVAGSTATSFTWAPDMYTTTYGSSNYQHLMGHTASTLAITINPNYTNTNFQYLLIYQSGNTCTITLTGNNIRTKGNITSFTVTAGQSIEFCALFVNGFTYVTYTIFG